jgi:hypothetical protein
MKLQFSPEQKSPTLEIGNGEYSRKFDVKDQPFDVDDEEARLLMATGHFVEASAKPESQVSSPKPQVMGKIGGAPVAE